MKLVLLSLVVFSALFGATSTLGAPVKLIAFDFGFPTIPLAHFPVLHIETGVTHRLDSSGHLMLDLPVGSNVSFRMPSYKGYHSTQTPIVTVPAEGLNTHLTEIVLEVPSDLVYDFFNVFSDGKKDPKKCQIVVTVCDVNKTWSDGAGKGLKGSKAFLHPSDETLIYYFGTFGKLSNDTNPFPNNLTHTSWDGGVLFENLPVSNETEYVITAEHPGYTFSETRFKCTIPGQFINGAPNQGPRASPDGNSNVDRKASVHPLRRRLSF